MNDNTELMTQEQDQPETRPAVLTPPAPLTIMAVAEVVQRVRHVEQIVKEVMTEGIHYGLQPGTKSKTLRQPGGEVLCIAFQLDPAMEPPEIEDLGGGHRNVTATCVLTSLVTGQEVGRAHGSCSTMETKYRYRYAELICPACDKETIRQSKNKAEGWYCWRKLGGCGATFPPGEAVIEQQPRGKVENPDLADVFNTVLKMAEKRAFLAVVRMRTGASALFQEGEAEGEEEDVPPPSKPTATRPAPRAVPPAAPPPQKSPADQKRTDLFAALDQSPYSRDQLRYHLTEAHGLTSTKDLTSAQYAQVMQWITRATVLFAHLEKSPYTTEDLHRHLVEAYDLDSINTLTPVQYTEVMDWISEATTYVLHAAEEATQ